MTFLRWARIHWDRTAGAALIALGGIFIVIGWNRVSGEALTAQQIPYVVSGGIGGLFLFGFGGMLWLSADLRDEWRKLDAIEERLPEPAIPEGADPFATEAADATEVREAEEDGRTARPAPRRGRRRAGAGAGDDR
jgi:hypothetical protein